MQENTKYNQGTLTKQRTPCLRKVQTKKALLISYLGKRHSTKYHREVRTLPLRGHEQLRSEVNSTPSHLTLPANTHLFSLRKCSFKFTLPHIW